MPKRRVSPQQLTAARRKAAKASHIAQGYRVSDDRDDDDRPTPAGDLPGTCDYDPAVRGGSITYHDAKAREQVIAEQIDNETKREEAAIRRRSLFTKKQVSEREETIAATLLDVLNRLLPEAFAGVGPAGSSEVNRAQAKPAIRAIRAALADELRAKGL